MSAEKESARTVRVKMTNGSINYTARARAIREPYTVRVLFYRQTNDNISRRIPARRHACIGTDEQVQV